MSWKSFEENFLYCLKWYRRKKGGKFIKIGTPDCHIWFRSEDIDMSFNDENILDIEEYPNEKNK